MRTRAVLVATAAALALAGSALSAAAATPQAATPVTVTVNSATNGHVGTGFAGFSYEKDRIGAGMFDAKDTNLVNLFKLLGPSVLRIGGNLVDIVNWNAKGTGGSAQEIAPADLTQLPRVLHATRRKGNYRVNPQTHPTPHPPPDGPLPPNNA